LSKNIDDILAEIDNIATLLPALTTALCELNILITLQLPEVIQH